MNLFSSLSRLVFDIVYAKGRSVDMKHMVKNCSVQSPEETSRESERRRGSQHLLQWLVQPLIASLNLPRIRKDILTTRTLAWTQQDCKHH